MNTLREIRAIGIARTSISVTGRLPGAFPLKRGARIIRTQYSMSSAVFVTESS